MQMFVMTRDFERLFNASNAVSHFLFDGEHRLCGLCG